MSAAASATNQQPQPNKVSNQEQQQEQFNSEKLAYNNNVVYFSRICISSLVGCATGILGFTGVLGFLCYFLGYGLISLLILLKMRFQSDKYFPSWSTLVWEGVFQGMLSFILFWTLLYDVVHIY